MERWCALLTGASGFTGAYVARELLRCGYEVAGLATASGDVDLLDAAAVCAAIDSIQPDVVIHLAAVSFVGHDNAEDLYRVNVIGTRNLLRALAKLSDVPSRIILASSANVYGNAGVEPITERVLPRPENDYAVSKLAMEHMARLWMDRLPITIVRPFNYTGVGQSPRYLIPKIVDHFRHGARRIELGNLHVSRDFSDVRAVAKIYARLADCAPASETLNIASGRAYSIEEILEMMCRIAGYQIKVDTNPAFVRQNEVHRLVGSTEKLRHLLHELPARPLPDTLQWMFGAEGGMPTIGTRSTNSIECHKNSTQNP